MNHQQIDNETLTLYYYGDGLDDSQRSDIATALVSDSALAERYADLCLQLKALCEWPSPVAPPLARRRWHRSIEQVAQAQRPAVSPASRLASIFAAAAALLVGIGISQHFLAPNNSDDGEGSFVAERGVSPNQLRRGVAVHLQDSRVHLVSMASVQTHKEQELLIQIIDQNRLYASAAMNSNAPELARTLRAFESVLRSLAASDTTPENLMALRSQLLFELQVAQTKLLADASDQQISF